MTEIRDGEDLWQWSQLEIRPNAFRWSIIPQTIHYHIHIHIHMYAGLLVSRGAKNVSWPWLSPLRGWGSLTMAFIGKFVNLHR